MISPVAAGGASTVLVLLVDQLTKAVVLAYEDVFSTGIEVLPVLNLVLVRNPGVSFGLFGSVPWWIHVPFGLAAVSVMAVWLLRNKSRTAAVAIGSVMGGALGNVADRAIHGAVTDFLDVHLTGYHWPAFNLADVAIVCGVLSLVLGSLRDSAGAVRRPVRE